MITESKKEAEQFESIISRLQEIADASENDNLSNIIEELEDLVKYKVKGEEGG